MNFIFDIHDYKIIASYSTADTLLTDRGTKQVTI